MSRIETIAEEPLATDIALVDSKCDVPIGSSVCGARRSRIGRRLRALAPERRRRSFDQTNTAGAASLLALAQRDDLARVDAVLQQLIADLVGPIERRGELSLSFLSA